MFFIVYTDIFAQLSCNLRPLIKINLQLCVLKAGVYVTTQIYSVSFFIRHCTRCMSNATESTQCTNNRIKAVRGILGKTCLDPYQKNYKAASCSLSVLHFYWVTLKAVMLKTLSYNNCVRMCVLVSIYASRDLSATQPPCHNLTAHRKAVCFSAPCLNVKIGLFYTQLLLFNSLFFIQL